MTRKILTVALLICFVISCKTQKSDKSSTSSSSNQVNEPTYVVNKFDVKVPKVIKSEEEWQKELTDNEYYVLRKKGTERAFTSPLNANKESGLYQCAGCNTTLFTSSTKFDSGTGWPSFFRPEDENMIEEDTDYLLGYARTEVLCAICGGHLGHVFEDGPPPTGLRYCINGVALDFVKAEN